MLTCGECKHFKWAVGYTGRKLKIKDGICGGLDGIKWPQAFIDYPGKPPMIFQARHCYHDSQHASQCAAFEKKDCAPSGKGVYTASTRTTNQEANA